MYPIIYIGNIVIPTYGVIALFTFLFTLWLIKFYAIKDNFDYRKARDVYLYAACAALVGAKLLAVITEMPRIIENPRYIWRILITGGVFYGGLFGGILCIVLYSHFQKINLFHLLDMLFPMVALSMAIDRWGCFASGCCFGKPTTLPWGVKFTNETVFKIHADLPSVPLHPTQIYLSINSLIIFIILTLIYRRKKFHGQIMFSYLLFYGIGRFFIEYFRFDFRGIMLGGFLSTSQIIALISSILSLIALLYLARRAKRTTESIKIKQ